MLAAAALVALCLASLAAGDDCGGHRCPPPEITTPEPNRVTARATIARGA